MHKLYRVFRRPIFYQVNRNKSLWNDSEFLEKVAQLNLNPSASQKQAEIDTLEKLYSSYSKDVVELMKNKFFLSEEKALKVVQENKVLLKKNVSGISSNIDLLKEVIPKPHDYEKDISVWLKMCKLVSPMLHHRIGMMQELGIEITPDSIFKHRDTCVLPVGELIKSGVIKRDFITTVFVSLHSPEHVLESLPLIDSELDTALIHLWFKLSRIFLKWKIGVSETDFVNLVNKKCYFLHRSLRLQSEVISILKQHFDFTDVKFLSHSYLLATVPSQAQDYLRYDQPICGYSTKEIVCMVPSIVRKPLSDTLQTEAILKHISIQSGQRAATTSLSLFTYPPSTVLSRTKYFLTKSNLSDLRLSPNNTMLMVHFDRCKKRLEELTTKQTRELLLPGPVVLFHRNITCLVKVKRAFYVNFLKMTLNIDKRDVYTALAQIHIIHYADFEDIKKNLCFLLSEKFSLAQIRKAFHLLIYPHNILVSCYQKDIWDCKYTKEYVEMNENNKLLQILLYKINKKYITLGGAYV